MERNRVEKMSEQKILPLGSVVKLNGSEQKFMIVSRGMILNVEGEKKYVDYGACIFPEGVEGDRLIYFNHAEIAEIQYKGFTDELDERMVHNLKKAQEKSGIQRMDIVKLKQSYSSRQEADAHGRSN